jgi:hypothetical protein
MLFSLMGLAGTVIGLLLLAIAMFRTAVVPRWVPALLVAFLILEFAGSSLSSYASDVAGACYLIAFAALAVRLRRMPVEAWRSVGEAQVVSPSVSARIAS